MISALGKSAHIHCPPITCFIFSCLCYTAIQLYASHVLDPLPPHPKRCNSFQLNKHLLSTYCLQGLAKKQEDWTKEFPETRRKAWKKSWERGRDCHVLPTSTWIRFRRRTEWINGIKYLKRRKMSRVSEMHESSEQQCPKDQNRRKKRCHMLSGDIVVRFQNTRHKALISLRKKEKADDFY